MWWKKIFIRVDGIRKKGNREKINLYWIFIKRAKNLDAKISLIEWKVEWNIE